MFDCCESWIEIKCKDEKSAELVYGSIEHWTEKLSIESEFGEKWLGNVLVNTGLYANEEELLEKYNDNPSCKGFVNDIRMRDCSVFVQTMTKLVPMMKIWKEIANKIFPQEVEDILYTAREINYKTFWTNDPSYKDAWYYEADDGYDTCASEEDVKRCLLVHVNGEIKDYEKCSVEELMAEIKDIEKNNTDIVDSLWLILLNLNKYKFVPIESEKMH